MNYENYLKTDTWRRLANERLKIDNYQCVMCGAKGTTSNPLEVHHLSYRNLYRERVFEDLVTLCHCCHKGLHRVLERVTSEDGRRGWRDNPQIPNVSIYTITGADIEFREVKNEEI